MLTAGINMVLITNMFHSDFRYHLKAIENLSEVWKTDCVTIENIKTFGSRVLKNK